MKTCAVIVFIVSLIVSIYGLTAEERNRAETVHRECQADPKTHIDEEVMKKFQRGEHIEKSVVGAHVLCMSTKFGFLTEDGKVNRNVLRKGFSRAISDPSKLDELVEKCGVEKGDPQETAMALGACFREHAGLQGHQHHHH